jgi:hypothetical protein
MSLDESVEKQSRCPRAHYCHSVREYAWRWSRGRRMVRVTAWFVLGWPPTWVALQHNRILPPRSTHRRVFRRRDRSIHRSSRWRKVSAGDRKHVSEPHCVSALVPRAVRHSICVAQSSMPAPSAEHGRLATVSARIAYPPSFLRRHAVIWSGLLKVIHSVLLC